MKPFVKREIVSTLPSMLMFFMALLVMEGAMCVGILSGRPNLTATAISIYVIVMFLMAVLLIGFAGKELLSHLRDANYYANLKRNGVSGMAALGVSLGINSAALAVMMALYALFMWIDIRWIEHVFPEEKKDLESLFEIVMKENSVILAMLDYLIIIVSLFALVYCSVTLTYIVFSKGRYAGFLSAIVFVMLAFCMIKLNLMICRDMTGAAFHLRSAAVQAGFTVLFFGLTCYSLKKHEWKDL